MRNMLKHRAARLPVLVGLGRQLRKKGEHSDTASVGMYLNTFESKARYKVECKRKRSGGHPDRPSIPTGLGAVGGSSTLIIRHLSMKTNP